MQRDDEPPRIFVVVALFDAMEVGTCFSRRQWPAYVTIASNFAVDAAADQVVSALHRAETLTDPLTFRFGGRDRFGPDHDVPVQLVEQGRVAELHDRVARQLETLDGLTAELPDHWHAGYRPHLTITAAVSPDEGSVLSAVCIAVAQIRAADATVVAALPIRTPEAGPGRDAGRHGAG